jgi:CHAT domain-containing protein
MIDLVILSACETGSGLTMGGEGLLSLSRAFMYAGSDGIISTLYKTDDRVTAFMMNRLAYYRQRNISTEEALRQSKIDLLSSDELNWRVKSPNYWSGFVYIGRIDDNTPKTKRQWLMAIALLGLSMITYYLIRKKVTFKK